MATAPPKCSPLKATCLNDVPFADDCAGLETGCNETGRGVPSNLHRYVRCRVNPIALIAGLLALTLLTLLASCGSEEPTRRGGEEQSREGTATLGPTPRPTVVVAETSAETDRQALIAFYEAVGGPDWKDNTNWLTDAPLGEWYGVTTDANGRVVTLNLSDNDVVGELVPELANLTRLVELDLSPNQISGGIPPEFGGFANLRRMYLGTNRLTGNIPPELGNLPAMSEVSLTEEQLSESIYYIEENEIREINLWNNQLSGEIPPELGKLHGILGLRLAFNRLEGKIPEELSQMRSLRTLNFRENRLSGEIPASLAAMPFLYGIYLGDNQFNGEIPPEFGQMKYLWSLSLGGNRLEGEIPPELADAPSLTYLDLEDNELSGEIPEELGFLAEIRGLNLSNNRLSGGIPGSLGGLEELETLNLTGNRLTGAFPQELGRLTELHWLYIGGNHITGCVPAEMDRPLDMIGVKDLVTGIKHEPSDLGGLPFCTESATAARRPQTASATAVPAIEPTATMLPGSCQGGVPVRSRVSADSRVSIEFLQASWSEYVQDDGTVLPVIIQPVWVTNSHRLDAIVHPRVEVPSHPGQFRWAEGIVSYIQEPRDLWKLNSRAIEEIEIALIPDSPDWDWDSFDYGCDLEIQFYLHKYEQPPRGEGGPVDAFGIQYGGRVLDEFQAIGVRTITLNPP